jgi:hypothetical protein
MYSFYVPVEYVSGWSALSISHEVSPLLRCAVVFDEFVSLGGSVGSEWSSFSGMCMLEDGRFILDLLFCLGSYTRS